MPKLNPIQTNFTAGELSDRLMGRVDIARYQNGAKEILNGLPIVEGGVMRRSGLRRIASTKDMNGTRLVSYVFNKSEAYVVELGAAYARFYNSDGQVVTGSTPVEVATPYAASELFDAEYVQGSDSMLLAHPSHMIQRLYRVSSTQWLMNDAPFDPLPFGENGKRPAAGLVLSGVSGAIVATPTADVFIASDVGRDLVAGSGVGEVTSKNSDGTLTITVKSQFDTTSYSASDWKLAGSPQVPVCALTKGPVGAIPRVYAMGARQYVNAMSLDASSSTLTIQTESPHGFAAGDFINLSFFESDGIDGNYYVGSVTGANTFTVRYTGSLLASAAFGYIYKFGAGVAFRGDEVGMYIRMNGGLLKIQSVDSSGQVSAKIVKTLSESTTAEGSAWSLESTLWNSVDGYPASVALFQQRLVAAGSENFPQTMWGSSTGTLYDFTIATDDDDAFQFSASSDQVSPIKHLVTASTMGAFTDGVEFTVGVGANNTIGPTDAPAVKAQSTYGSSAARPVKVGNEIVFVQRGARKVRALSYDFASDSFVSVDMTALAQHISLGGIVDAAFQQEPTPVIWFVRADGVLISVTYDKQQNVTAWARHTTDGKFLSVACIPSSTVDEGDLVFVVGERTVNGSTVRFVERFDADLNTDCAVTGTATTPSATWSGLSALEGKTVDVKADGIFVGQYTVSGGSITIPRTASTIEIGLHYDTSVTLLPPALNGATGTNIGSAQSTSQVILRVNDTIGGKVNGDEIPWREFGSSLLDKAPEPFTGDKDISTLGWDKGGDLVITQDQPYDWHLLAVIRTYSTNQG
jgi:hypothetical protein